MAEILRINGHDYSPFLETDGYSLSHEERNTVKLTDLAGGIHKFRSVVKDVVRVSLSMVPEDVRRQLESDVSALEFTVTYAGASGPVTRTCMTDAGLAATLGYELDDGFYWGTVQLEFYEK